MLKHRTGNRRGLWQDESGALSVEFMVIFPMILLVLFLIAFISLLISAASEVQQVAHELARASFRLLGTSAPPADVCAVLRTGLLPDLAQKTLMLSSDRLTLLPCPGLPGTGGMVTITLTYDFAGDFVQSLGQNFGLNLGIITRSSTTFF